MKPVAAAACVWVAMSAAPAAASGTLPAFAATCPTDIAVETTASGRATINGRTARVRTPNPDYAEISGAGVTVSVARNGSELIVSYTGKGRANGICQVLRQDPAARQQTPAPPSSPARTDTPPAAAAAPATPAVTLRDPIPSRDRTACVKAVRKTTNNPKVVVIGTVSSEANNTVTLGVGPNRAPWRCLVKRGIVADVMSLSDEGRL